MTYVFRITQIKHVPFVPPAGAGQCGTTEEALDGTNIDTPGYTYCALQLHNGSDSPQDAPPIIGSNSHRPTP